MNNEQAGDKMQRRVRIVAGAFVLGVGLIAYAVLTSDPNSLSPIGVVGVLLAGPAAGLLMVGAEPQ